eukprot:jgi/Phyca11/19055/fgenesh1_pg.PHYCAscaffold_43_\
MATQVDQKAEERLREVSAERQRWIAKREEALAPRKKELKELQAQAETAREKQRVAATVLTRSMKQLKAKRKRDETDASKQPRKKIVVGSQSDMETVVAVTPEMYPFAAAPDLDVIPREKLEQTFKIYTGKELAEVSSGFASGYRIQSLIALEKNVVAAVCDSEWQSNGQDLNTMNRLNGSETAPKHSTKKVDPMNKDYECDTTEVINASDELEVIGNARILKMDEVGQLLWPVITTAQASSTAEETHADKWPATSSGSSNEVEPKVPAACDAELEVEVGVRYVVSFWECSGVGC